MNFPHAQPAYAQYAAPHTPPRYPLAPLVGQALPVFRTVDTPAAPGMRSKYLTKEYWIQGQQGVIPGIPNAATAAAAVLTTALLLGYFTPKRGARRRAPARDFGFDLDPARRRRRRARRDASAAPLLISGDRSRRRRTSRRRSSRRRGRRDFGGFGF